MKNILVYGSLREGDYNFDRVKQMFGNNSIRKVNQIVLDGYAIFDLGHYPGLNKTDNPDHKVTFDILEVEQEAFNFIENMEINAGYSSVETEYGNLYVYNKQFNEDRRIKSGDWLDHKVNKTVRL